MASILNAQAVENIIGYKFQHGHDQLRKALTAAGVLDEDWDGNRKLAQFGTALSEFILTYLAFEAEATRANANDFKKSVASNEHRASIARRTGISGHIKFAEKDGSQSASVHAKAINAIIAAVFFDCKREIGTVARMMHHLGMFNTTSETINPTLLSLNELPESLDVASLARSLFSVNASDHPSLVMNSSYQIPWTCSWGTQNEVSTFQQPLAEIDDLSEGGDNGQNSPTQQGHFFRTEETNIELPMDELPNPSEQIVSTPTFAEEVASARNRVSVAYHSRKPTKKRASVHQAEEEQRTKLQKPNMNSNTHKVWTSSTGEGQRCQYRRPTTPANAFLTPVVQQEIEHPCKVKTALFTKILTNIGSPFLIGGLQDILKWWRTQGSSSMPGTTGAISRAERVRLIDDLDHTKSYFQLLQRHHILELFKDCSNPGTSNLGVLLTSSDFSNPLRRRGNPVNKSVAELTERMMQETYPSVERDTSEYKTKYRWISFLRRLGQRLQLLETRFGKGFLGIMLDQGLNGTDVGITDAMIMNPTDAEYTKLVDIIDKNQGSVLRDLSLAVLPAVQALTSGNVGEQRTFAIEKMTVEDITKYQKGSSEFLQLICEPIYTG